MMEKANQKLINQFVSLMPMFDIIIHCTLAALLFCIGLAGWVNWPFIWSTLTGMVIAAAGGLAIGITALRYLARSKGSREIILGLIITSGIGVLTIGYLYIVHIQESKLAIGTFTRAVNQSFIFGEFLIAQLSGIKLAKTLFPD